jgi:hypothetical protein
METPQTSLATVFRSAGYAGETEAMLVRGMLEANAVPAFITGVEGMPEPYKLPAREICVQVPLDRQHEAEQLIADALDAGPAAADQAEAFEASTGTVQ